MFKIEKKDLRIGRLVGSFVLLCLTFLLASTSSYAATLAPNATGLVDASDGVYVRAKATIDSSKVSTLTDNTKVTILKEIFVKKTSTKTVNKWYYISFAGKKGYIRADLVDNVKYAAKTGKTTDALNYRIGPGTFYNHKGTLDKGKEVSVVLAARYTGSKDVWYKIKKGVKYYYVTSEYVKSKTTSKTTSTSTTTSKTATTTKTEKVTSSNAGDTPSVSFSKKNVSAPTTLTQFSKFGLKGTITSSEPMDSVTVGVADSNGTWCISSKFTVNSNTFDITKADQYIVFGSLLAGKYTYKIVANIDGEEYPVHSSAFTITAVTGAKAITACAKLLAFPIGTSPSSYSYKHLKSTKVTKFDSDRPTQAMKLALNKYYPEHWTSWGSSKYGYGTRTGASCDVFVGTVVRASGYDSKYPRGFNNVPDYLKDSSKFKKVSFSYTTSNLKSGDIIIYKKNNGGVHTCIYVNVGGDDYIAEAGLNNYYGRMNSSLTKVLKKDKKWIYVYRAVK